MTDTIWLDVTERVAELPDVDPDLGVELTRITVPEHVVNGQEARAGYTMECPNCSRWTVLGLEGRIKREPGGGISLAEAFVCPRSSCDFVMGISDGVIDGYVPGGGDD